MACIRVRGSGPTVGEAYCVLIADQGISGSFTDGECFTGDLIGLEYQYHWRTDIRNNGTELWIVNDGVDN